MAVIVFIQDRMSVEHDVFRRILLGLIVCQFIFTKELECRRTNITCSFNQKILYPFEQVCIFLAVDELKSLTLNVCLVEFDREVESVLKNLISRFKQVAKLSPILQSILRCIIADI